MPLVDFIELLKAQPSIDSLAKTYYTKHRQYKQLNNKYLSLALSYRINNYKKKRGMRGDGDMEEFEM